MKYLLIFHFVFSCLQSSAQIGDISSFINSKYGDELKFSDLNNVGSAVIGAVDDKNILIGHYRHRTSIYLMLELQKEDMPVADPYDILKIELGVNQDIVYRSCRSSKIANTKIIALVNRTPDSEYFTEIIRVWVANEQTMKFEEIPTIDIDCENPDFGS